MKCGWREGNQIQLLENGDQFYPAVFEAIAQAQQKIILETFILFEDEVGKKLHAALLKAAQRGVKAEVLLDGYGSPDLSDAFVGELTSAGVIFRYYDPRPRLLGLRTNIFRRMHRKIVVIDDRIAFVGGINYSAEHMSDTARRRNKTTRYGSKGLLWPISCNSKSRICRGKAPRTAGGSAITRLKKTVTPAKRRRCLSGGITKSTVTISNVII